MFHGREKREYKSITEIMVLTLVGGITFVVTLFGMLNYYHENVERINALHMKLDTISEQLSTALASPIWTLDYTEIWDIMESFMKDREIHALYIRESSWFIGYYRQKDGTSGKLESEPAENGFIFSRSEIVFEGNVIANLGIYLTPLFREQELKHTHASLLAGCFVLILCLVSILFYVLRKTVIIPLKAIENYAEGVSIASGIPLVETGGKQSTLELVNLQKSIQEMVSQIRARYFEREESRIALEQAEKKYREIFDNAGEGIFQLSPEGRIITANPALARILGYGSSLEIMESVSHIADLYVDPGTGKSLKGLIRNGVGGEQFDVELYRKDKSIISVSVTFHAVVDNGNHLLCYQGMLKDITQKKRAEELKIAKEAAEASTRAKSDFLAAMSHEIRTPMNAIVGLTNLALKTPLTARQHDYLTKIENSSRNLLGIINDILDFSKIEAGEFKLDRVDFLLDDIWDNLSDLFADKIAEKGMELFFIIDNDIPSVLVGDPLRLRQIFINLTGNALKFTQQGEIIVRGSVVERLEEQVKLKFSVEDTGIGIAQEKIPALFMPFTQAEDFTTRQYGGTGLGLSICRQLVERMDGGIWANSDKSHGTSFEFTVVFGVKPREPEPLYVFPVSLRSRRILVVDDHPNCRGVLKRLLVVFGFQVEIAADGTEAIEKVREKGCVAPAFDLILMDWNMPGMDGITASKRIKLEPGGAEIPIIMITGYGQEIENRQAEASGIEAFLDKPITKKNLFNFLLRFFEDKRQLKEKPRQAMLTTEVIHKERFRGVRVLLVEDNDINRQIVVELLENRGIIVEHASDGREAVCRLTSGAEGSHPFDAVLMDVQMPGMDGFEATRIIREWESTRTGRIPIIAMTAHAIKGYREKCFEAGMDDYITKPIDRDRLFSTLKKWSFPKADFFYGLEDKEERIPVQEEKTGSNPVLPVDMPGIAISKGIRRVDGNRHLYLKLLRNFVNNHAGDIESIKSAVKEKDLKLALRMAHTLKGAAGGIAAATLFQLAATLEKALSNGMAPADSLVDESQGEMDRVVRSINSIGAEVSPSRDPALPVPDLETVIQDLKTMYGLLLQNYIDADKHLGKVAAFLAGSGFENEALDLESCLTRFDLNGAKNIMETIAQKLNISLLEKEVSDVTVGPGTAYSHH